LFRKGRQVRKLGDFFLVNNASMRHADSSAHLTRSTYRGERPRKLERRKKKEQTTFAGKKTQQ
jgi:hypothetical protein